MALEQLQPPLPPRPGDSQAVPGLSLDVVRGLEGEAANTYFGVFDHLIVAQKPEPAPTSAADPPYHLHRLWMRILADKRNPRRWMSSCLVPVGKSTGFCLPHAQPASAVGCGERDAFVSLRHARTRCPRGL